MTDYQDRLQKIYNLVSDYVASGRDMLVSTQRLLINVLELAEVEEPAEAEELDEQTPVQTKEEIEEEENMTNEIIISCDASVKENPGGPSSVGVVIRFPKETGIKPIELAKHTPAKSNNEAEYDAVYEGILSLVNIHNAPLYPIVVHSDSQLVVKQLTGEYKINNDTLKRKYAAIHELCSQIPLPVRIEWRPRNSTRDLAQANFIAQEALGVKRH